MPAEGRRNCTAPLVSARRGPPPRSAMPAPEAAARYLQVKHFILERTANRALRELAADGVLVRVAGVGTFVAEQRVHAHPLEVRNIADEIRARGHEYRVKVIALESVSAPRELAERCGVRPGAALDHSLLTHFEGAR